MSYIFSKNIKNSEKNGFFQKKIPIE